ncbi:MAG: hypothetical protein AcusKO_43870 [Acuticoccus sp.]
MAKIKSLATIAAGVSCLALVAGAAQAGEVSWWTPNFNVERAEELKTKFEAVAPPRHHAQYRELCIRTPVHHRPNQRRPLPQRIDHDARDICMPAERTAWLRPLRGRSIVGDD